MIHKRNEYPRHEDLESQEDRIKEREWDLLVVLDACRWDALDQITEKKVEKLRTPAESSTPDWVKTIWEEGGDWEDVTYLSANTFTTYVREMDEYGTVLENEVGEYVECWEDSRTTFGAVEPSAMRGNARTKEAPVVAHFIQPHTPFIGDTSIRVRSTSEKEMPDIVPPKSECDASNPVYRFVEKGEVSKELMRQAYLDNLKHAFKYVKRMTNDFDTVIVTADHGEALGPDEWSHGAADDPRARVVPWLEL